MARFERISPGHGRKSLWNHFWARLDDVGRFINSSPATVEGGTWIETVIFSFGGADGSSPFGRLCLMKPVHFMGPPTGSALGVRERYSKNLTHLSQPAPWSQSVLYNFSGGRDGGGPLGVTFGSGAAFGTASNGGNGRSNPGGVIFRPRSPPTPAIHDRRKSFTRLADSTEFPPSLPTAWRETMRCDDISRWAEWNWQCCRGDAAFKTKFPEEIGELVRVRGQVFQVAELGNVFARGLILLALG